jgi:hypothetical protein
MASPMASDNIRCAVPLELAHRKGTQQPLMAEKSIEAGAARGSHGIGSHAEAVRCAVLNYLAVR